MPVPSPCSSGKAHAGSAAVCDQGLVIGSGHLVWSPMVGGFYPSVFFLRGLGGGGVLTGQRMGVGGLTRVFLSSSPGPRVLGSLTQ